MEEPRRILRPAQAATYLGLSPSTLAKRRCWGLPPAFVRLGARAVGYDTDELDAWLAACRRTSTSEGGGNAARE
jgi:predicted DNA-binding transcriptional regulator AlpA